MVEKILNNTTPYGKIRASREGSLHSSTLIQSAVVPLTPSYCIKKPGLTGRTVLERCWSDEQNSSPLDTVHNSFTYVGDR